MSVGLGVKDGLIIPRQDNMARRRAGVLRKILHRFSRRLSIVFDHGIELVVGVLEGLRGLEVGSLPDHLKGCAVAESIVRVRSRVPANVILFFIHLCDKAFDISEVVFILMAPFCGKLAPSLNELAKTFLYIAAVDDQVVVQNYVLVYFHYMYTLGSSKLQPALILT